MADGKGQSTDVFIGWLFIGIIFFVLFFIIYFFYEYDIKSVIRWVRYAEMWAVSHFIDEDYLVPFKDQMLNFEKWRLVTPSLNKLQLTDNVMNQMSMTALYPVRYLFAAILFCMSVWCTFRGPKVLFRKSMDLKMLMREQAKMFPVIRPFVKFDPSKQPARAPGSPVPAELPLFAEALGPEEWIAFNNIPMPDGKLDRDVAAAALAKQLGASWRGPEKLKPHMQVLLAAFCLKAARKRGESDDMLGEIAAGWDYQKGLRIPGKTLRAARKVLKNKDIAGKTLAKCNQHAFETTALIRALLTAREEGGVLAPAQFVWLRGYDRSLWYPLNNLGRQAFHPEAMGAMAHYKAEKMTQRPIIRPRMDDATKTLEEYFTSDLARPIPPLDYSKAKKTKSIKKLKGSK
ncbi:MAG: type IV secretion system protein [Alphaproteobacteria bacterium]|nr:type IV secretion system protein [Alphaproteobacteria bacterium]